MPLTPDAKKLLAETIRGTEPAPERGLRARLLRAIHDEADRCYRLSVPIEDAGLDEVHRKRRERVESWIDERARAARRENGPSLDAARKRILEQAEIDAAATLVNRLVLLRHLEALGLSKPALVSSGWNSKAYREFREFAPALTSDETEGYSSLLKLLFDELAVDLPGLFGDTGLTALLPISPSALRDVVDALDDPGLAPAWTDDTTLGWVYQYWNDPERRRIDATLDEQSKLESADIAAKTQVFTERYMVEWLLQNSLGVTWLGICKKNGWKADADAVHPGLLARRQDWREKREAGQVPAGALMPIQGELEEHWKYYLPQPISDEAARKAPASVRDIKLLDPACGSGHFLVIAFDLLAALYREEARHRGESVSAREIAESIVQNNLFGIDIDPRAIQIAAAGLYLKAKSLARDARPKRMNLVAPALELGSLSLDDPTVVHLRQDLRREVGIPDEATDALLASLTGADHLGSLFKVEAEIEEMLRSAALLPKRARGEEARMDERAAAPGKRSAGEARAAILTRLERFLASHSSSEDLGLRLDGEHLAAGMRFLQIACPGVYDVVAGNPPYFGTQALAETGYIDKTYPESKENLCTALFERATELVREGGQVAFVTVRNWLYVSQLSAFRGRILRGFPPHCAADLGLGGFESLPGVEVMMVVARRGVGSACVVADVRDATPAEKVPNLLCTRRTYQTDPALLAKIPNAPFVYRWSREFIEDYLSRPLLGGVAPVRVGMKTSDNLRFLRRPWELAPSDVREAMHGAGIADWAPYIKGAAGKVWIEPLADLVDWRDRGLAIRLALHAAYGQGPQGEKHFFQRGVAFSTIGRSFIARAHRYPSLFDVAGSSVFPPDVAQAVCLLNSRFAREVVEDLNPTINFQVGDVARIPYRPDARAAEVFRVLEGAFAEDEAGDELSPSFQMPAPSSWRQSQRWAQAVLDSPETDGLLAHTPIHDPPAACALVSFAVGVTLGRFGAKGEGWVEEPAASAVPSGLLFLSAAALHDGLDHPACRPLHETWKSHGAAVGGGEDLRTYLRKSFFDAHKKLYENRPIYFPISSSKKSFVALASIHRWGQSTLEVLLADHLMPEKRRLEGELEDIQKARAEIGGRTSRAEKRLAELQKLIEELRELITKVVEVAEKGPPAPDDRTPKREVDARYTMDLGDGVMVNSAALWPLLEPAWKDPKKWWGQLASRNGPKGTHFDWSKTAARYFPARVEKGCEESPVLAAAHGRLWRDHPKVAYAWELRLEHDFRPSFSLAEPDVERYRDRFFADQPEVAREVRATEMKRRERRGRSRVPRGVRIESEDTDT